MLNRCVLVLGSGKSILDLSSKERELLNSFDVKIGINKYAAFCEITDIDPTHIYFHDDHYQSSVLFFNYLVKKVRIRKLKNITFIVSANTAKFLKLNTISYQFAGFFRNIKYTIKKIFKFKALDRVYVLLPEKSNVISVDIEHYTKKGTPWAKKLGEPLYHFKGSFSTVLNYISICYPNRIVLLVGVDFNSSDYFFEEELDKLDFNTKDWTYKLRKDSNKHYSIIETDGVKMDDEFPFMLNELKKTKNTLYSLNNSSYLVEKGFIESISLEDLKKQMC